MVCDTRRYLCLVENDATHNTPVSPALHYCFTMRTYSNPVLASNNGGWGGGRLCDEDEDIDGSKLTVDIDL